MSSLDELVSILRELGVECARRFEEEVDEQFHALSLLSERLEDLSQFLKLVLMNSVVSYQLSSTGERWWWEFSRWFSEHPIEGELLGEYISFLRASKRNVRLKEQKLSRVKRLWPLLEPLSEGDLLRFYEDMIHLRDKICISLNSKPTAKTVVFAIKMYGYGSRIAFRRFIPYPMEIDIPLDKRILRLTGALLKRNFTEKEAIKLWRRISEETGIPPLHLDSLLWPLLRRGELKEELPCGEGLRLLLREIWG